MARLSTCVHTTVYKGKQNVLDPNDDQKIIMHTARKDAKHVVKCKVRLNNYSRLNRTLYTLMHSWWFIV